MHSGKEREMMLQNKMRKEEKRMKKEASRSTSANSRLRDPNDVVLRLYTHKKIYDVRKEQNKNKRYQEVLFNKIIEVHVFTLHKQRT